MKRQYKKLKYPNSTWCSTAEEVIRENVQHDDSGYYRKDRCIEDQIKELTRIVAEIADRSSIDLTEFTTGFIKVDPQD